MGICTESKNLIYYTKGKQTTKELEISTQKPSLGKGCIGEVFPHKLNPMHLVVKKSKASLVNEFEIGSHLDHPNIVKVRALYIKQSSNNNPLKYKLVMDRIYGKQLKELYKTGLDNASVHSLLTQAQSACIYLFTQKVKWGDVNGENAYVSEKNQLTVADFGQWKIEQSPEKRGFSLLKETQKIMFNILSVSSLRNTEKSSFKDLLFSLDPYSKDGTPTKKTIQILKTPLTKGDFQNKSEEEVQEILTTYCAQVINNFQNSPIF